MKQIPIDLSGLSHSHGLNSRKDFQMHVRKELKCREVYSTYDLSDSPKLFVPIEPIKVKIVLKPNDAIPLRDK